MPPDIGATPVQDGIGAPVRRREDERLVAGRGRYTSDLSRPGMLYLMLLRSPHAHARIARIETAAASAAPGVVAVITAADLADMNRLPAQPAVPDMIVAPTPLLAAQSVHHDGQAVAAVIAEEAVQARDALDLIEVDYDLLPAVVDPVTASQFDAPLAFPDLGTNVAYRLHQVSGDVETAFERAAHVVRVHERQSRIAAVPLEARAVLAEWDDEAQTLTLWAGVQAPFRARATLAAVLGIQETHIRVIAPDVGGGFGVKGGLYAEEVLAAVLSRRLRRPVSWTGSRGEDLQTTQHAREQVLAAEAALDGDGRLLALRLHVTCNLGAGARGAGVPNRIIQCCTGCYRVDAVETRTTAVYTNTTPTGAFRGAGRPEATYIIERIMDEASAQLGVDPAELRRRNFVTPTDLPYTAPTGMTLDSGDYQRLLDECLRLLDYRAARREQAAARSRGELMGIGLATYIELTGSGWESGAVRVLPSGLVEVTTGSTDQGQGHGTTWSQIVASVLAVPASQVAVRQGDTALLASGVGTFGSRSTPVGGTAVALAAEEVRRKMLDLAAHQLEVSVDDLEWQAGAVSVRGAPARRVEFRQLAASAYGGRLPAGMEPGLEVVRYFQPEGETFSGGAYAAVVSVDRETGAVQVRRFVAVDDCGVVINPRLVEGQLFGGLAQGIGQALWEHVLYDAEGHLVSGSLMDYSLPRAGMLPPITLARVETPSPRNPLGAKGVGEAGTIGGPIVLANAVADALRPLGIGGLEMPLTPARVWSALQASGR